MRPVLIIEAGKSEEQYLRDLWRYRELFFFLAWRDILVRYKQTVLGVLWAIIRPLLTLIVFSLVFGRLARLPSSGAPYPLLVLAALIPWQFFAGAVAEGANSLIGNANLLSKVFFPRLLIPLSATAGSAIELLISLALLLFLMIHYGVAPTFRLLLLLPLSLLALLAATGAGVWLAALSVKYRDFRYVVPFLIQFGAYASPVGYTSALVSDRYRLLFSMNPMVGVIDGFRYAILGPGQPLFLPGLLLSLLGTGVLLASGLYYFRRAERAFADVI